MGGDGALQALLGKDFGGGFVGGGFGGCEPASSVSWNSGCVRCALL